MSDAPELGPIPLTLHPYDRIAHRRRDEAWLADAWDRSSVLLVAGSRFRLGETGPAWSEPSALIGIDGHPVLLGEDADGRPRFAYVARPEVADDASEWVGLRGAVAGLGGDDADLVAHAVGIAEWLASTRHCSRCGGELEVLAGGHEQVCTQCGRPQFPRTDPAVIMIVVDRDRCLLGRQREWPEGRYSTLAGFVEPGESLEAAVRREVLEEVGVRVGRVEYRGSQPWPLPSSLMVGFVAHAESTEIDVDGDEIETARWFTRDDIRSGAESGELLLPGSISISRALVEHWFGGPLPGSW